MAIAAEQQAALRSDQLAEQSASDKRVADQPSPASAGSNDHISLEVGFTPGMDVLGLIERLLEPARSGDREAQYAIYEAMEYCIDAYKGYFDRGAKRRTLDEALTWASTRHAINMDAIRTSYASCNAFMSTDVSKFGSPEEWLESLQALDCRKPRLETLRGFCSMQCSQPCLAMQPQKIAVRHSKPSASRRER